MERVFFQATRDALNNITELYNFVHPLTISLIYTRSSVKTIKDGHPEYTDNDFRSVIDPSNKVHGVGYEKAFLKTSMAEQEQNLAWLLLNNLFSIHEGWAYRLYHERFESYNFDERTFEDNLKSEELSQKFSKYFIQKGNKSTLMCNTFFSNYKDEANLDFKKLHNYMLMYRFFKETRNSYMHANKIATDNVIESYNKYMAVATERNLDTTEIPQIYPPIKGSPIKINLRGVIGFSDFLRRILIISDIMLIKTYAAEDELLSYKENGERLLSSKPQKRRIDTLSSNQSRARQQISKYTNQNGFLKPIWSEEYQNFLIKNGILKK